MKCPACRTDNRAERRFCSACGKVLPVPCPRCAFVNEPDEAFCGGCGEQLPGPGGQEGKPARETAAPYEIAPGRHGYDGDRRGQDGDRRQITVMFCDLAGSTPLAARLDPEDLREVICTYQAACAAVIERYEGHIAQFLGDGLVVTSTSSGP
jgi:hypothetical protein